MAAKKRITPQGKRSGRSTEPTIGDLAVGSAAGSANDQGIGNTAGLGAGGGYDVIGNLGSTETAATHPDPSADYETSGLGRGKGVGRDGAVGGAIGDTGAGGGTGGMTGVGGAGSRQGVSDTGSALGHANDNAPVAGGVAVSAGRGSDVGNAEHGLGNERGGMSGGTTGGSAGQDVGGLSGSGRDGLGTDVSGGRGGSRSNDQGDPAEGSADVSTDSQPGGINERS